MTNNILRYEIVISVENTTANYKPNFKSKSRVARVHNGRIEQSDKSAPFFVLNPVQKIEKRDDTPMYAVYEDGSRVEVATRAFFKACFPQEDWYQLNCDVNTDDLDSDDLDEVFWCEDKEDRVNTIVLEIDRTSLEKFNASMNRGYASIHKGRRIRYCSFTGKVQYKQTFCNTKPLRLRELPSIPTEEDYYKEYDKAPTLATKAAKSAMSAPILKDELDEFDEQCEHVKVPAEASSQEEVDALFGAPSESPDLLW